MRFFYWTCEDCAHVATTQGDEDYARCENCGSSDVVQFTALDEAEDYSKEILDARD